MPLAITPEIYTDQIPAHRITVEPTAKPVNDADQENIPQPLIQLTDGHHLFETDEFMPPTVQLAGEGTPQPPVPSLGNDVYQELAPLCGLNIAQDVDDSGRPSGLTLTLECDSNNRTVEWLDPSTNRRYPVEEVNVETRLRFGIPGELPIANQVSAATVAAGREYTVLGGWPGEREEAIVIGPGDGIVDVPSRLNDGTKYVEIPTPNACQGIPQKGDFVTLYEDVGGRGNQLNLHGGEGGYSWFDPSQGTRYPVYPSANTRFELNIPDPLANAVSAIVLPRNLSVYASFYSGDRLTSVSLNPGNNNMTEINNGEPNDRISKIGLVERTKCPHTIFLPLVGR